MPVRYTRHREHNEKQRCQTDKKPCWTALEKFGFLVHFLTFGH